MMINAAIVGLPDCWENEYGPALQRLAGRVRVARLYDPVLARSRTLARPLKVPVESGILTMAERPG